MKGAECFIEVYKADENMELFITTINPINRLKGVLRATRNLSTLKTIAIWYIKPLNKTNAKP